MVGNWVNMRTGKTGFGWNFVWSPAKSNLAKANSHLKNRLKNLIWFIDVL